MAVMDGAFVGVCPLCDLPLHRQALAVETPLGWVHQVCALTLEQRAGVDE